MLFHSFNSPEERRAFGGSAFMEIQFCDMPLQAPLKRIVSLNHIRHWRNDSLYVHADDMEIFYQEYSRIFDSGVFSNLKTGTIDLFGLNYYSPALIESVIEKLDREEPRDYKELMAWLVKSRAHNGVYILGI